METQNNHHHSNQNFMLTCRQSINLVKIQVKVLIGNYKDSN